MKKFVVKCLSVFMALFPWITYFHLIQYSEEQKAIYGGNNGVNLDFFINSKEVVLLIVIALVVLCFLIEQYVEGKNARLPLFQKQNRWLFVLMGVFLVGTFVSTLMAEHMSIALWGSHEIGEGLWTLVAYTLIICMYYHYFASEDALTSIKHAIVGLSGITGLLSLVEWFYKPILEIDWIRKLVAPAQYQAMLESLKADRFTDAISLTFYNPGYFGGFVCILVPFMLAFYLGAKEKKAKLLYGLLFVGLLFGVIASGSTTALYVAVAEVVLVIVSSVILAPKRKAAGIQSGVALVITAVSLVVFGNVTGNHVIHIASNDNSIAEDVWWWNFAVNDIKMEGNSVQLVSWEKTLGIYYENGRFVFRDELGNELNPIRTEAGVTFVEEGFAGVRVSAVDVTNQVDGATRCVRVEAGYFDPIEFFLLEDGTFSGIGQGGSIIKDIGDGGAPKALKPYYGILTGRGYIWANTLPILKETWLLGKGPGNYAFHFKNFDYVGMLSIYKTTQKVITKPHNAYLQYATELGVPAAVAFWGIFVGALLRSLKTLRKKKQEIAEIPYGDVFIAAIVSVTGFLLSSMINDSMITVTPVVCMVVGVLFAGNFILEQHK